MVRPTRSPCCKPCGHELPPSKPTYPAGSWRSHSCTRAGATSAAHSSGEKPCYREWPGPRESTRDIEKETGWRDIPVIASRLHRGAREGGSWAFSLFQGTNSENIFAHSEIIVSSFLLSRVVGCFKELRGEGSTPWLGMVGHVCQPST